MAVPGKVTGTRGTGLGPGRASVPLPWPACPLPVCRVTQVFPSSGPDVIKPTIDLGETDEKKSQVSADSGVSLTSGSQVCDSLVQNREHSQVTISEYFFKTKTKRQS